jgi:zinc transport system substrate-binding protein
MNRDTYLDKLDELDKEISDKLADVQNRAFIVFHPSWGYFASDYNLEQIAIEVDGKEPSAQDIAHVIEEAKDHNIKVVFASPQFNPQSAEVIAREIDGRVILIDNLARDYIENMQAVLDELSQAME